MIDKSKDTYQQYRERARELYARVAVFHGDAFGTNAVVDEINVPHHAVVHLCEDGAFVEAIVWVPKEKLVHQIPAVCVDTRESIDEGSDQGRYDACDRSE